MRYTDLIVIHCSATREGLDISIDTFRKWHKARGFRDIGYHFIIHPDGNVERGRPIEQVGAHARGYNKNSVGVCYIGGLDKDLNPKDTRTRKQKISLRLLVDVLQIVYGQMEIVGHRDLSVDLNGDGVISKDEWMKDCPCFDIKTEL